MHRNQRTLTLGELISVVAECSRNDHEVGLAVVDLMQRGVVVSARPSVVRAMLRAVGRRHRH